MKHNLEQMQSIECINNDRILFPPHTFIYLLGVWEIHDIVDNVKVILDVYSKYMMSEDVNMLWNVTLHLSSEALFESC
jgi:hypothetical protein